MFAPECKALKPRRQDHPNVKSNKRTARRNLRRHSPEISIQYDSENFRGRLNTSPVRFNRYRLSGEIYGTRTLENHVRR